jgi:hypothetical protein
MSGKEAWTVGATHLPLGDLPSAFTSAGLAIARMVELGTASLSDTGRRGDYRRKRARWLTGPNVY